MNNQELDFEDLQPYRTLLLGEMKSNTTKGDLIKNCLEDIREVLGITKESESVEDESSKAESEQSSGGIDRREINWDHNKNGQELEHGFIHYKLKKSASWTSEDDIRDIENHLVVVTMRKGTEYVAFYTSETSKRRKLRARFDNLDYDGLGRLREIPPENLNAVFFGDEVRTLWMSGMHQRTSVKADSKVLSGTDLEYTLDPINDQTFYFSAARSRHQNINRSVGISPTKSRIWTHRSTSWNDYEENVKEILDLLAQQDQGEERPLSVLAKFADPDNVGDPYDLVIQPPETLDRDAEQNAETRDRLETWSYDVHFDLQDTSSQSKIQAKVTYKGKKLGEIKIELDDFDSEDVGINSVTIDSDISELPDKLQRPPDEETKAHDADGEGDNEESSEPLSELEELCQKSNRLKIYFESGHTLVDGDFYKASFRDQPFRNFCWLDFGDQYDITSEKPNNFPTDGNDINWDDEPYSLFKWVRESWPPNSDLWQDATNAPSGWLACDDGGTEVADFIHLTTETETPILSLIHIKAAGSATSNRQISVACYEKVTGQAVKQLRNLDNDTLGDNLHDSIGNKVGSYVWKNGKYVDRQDMVQELKDLGSDYQSIVVVIQPHIQKSHHKKAKKEDDSQDAQRLNQLRTLLLGAENACNGLGAEFRVISAKN
jgi:hypothetical protein